jgi:hypothetical protein
MAPCAYRAGSSGCKLTEPVEYPQLQDPIADAGFRSDGAGETPNGRLYNKRVGSGAPQTKTKIVAARDDLEG